MTPPSAATPTSDEDPVRAPGSHIAIVEDRDAPPASQAAARADPRVRQAAWISYLLMVSGLLIIMWKGLLAGLLCVCLGFTVTRWMGVQLRRLTGAQTRRARVLAGIVVAVLPLLVLGLAVPKIRTLVLDAPAQYRELLSFLAKTVLDLRDKLPPAIAAEIPEGLTEIQRTVAVYLASKAGTLATAGRAWITGLLLAFVGLIIGILAAVRPAPKRLRPLTLALHERMENFGMIFSQIVAAQFWIALFNTCLTAIFLLLIIPTVATRLPYTTALIALTFVAGLIPIVGNLVCNTVLTLVGLSVSLPVAVACLVFLILIHKMEYFINAKVIGSRTHMGAWELLAVMFVLEAIFGPAGLVAAPLFYAYAKRELEIRDWV